MDSEPKIQLTEPVLLTDDPTVHLGFPRMVRARNGDLLLFYTDGLEAFLVGKDTAPSDKAILHTDWIKQLAADGPDPALDQIQDRAKRREATDWSRDDITALVIQMS